MKTVAFTDLETSDLSDKATDDFEAGDSGLPKDSNWTGIVADSPDVLFVNDSSMEVNSLLYIKQLFTIYSYHVTVSETKGCSSSSYAHFLRLRFVMF